jgi:hypothetical protein
MVIDGHSRLAYSELLRDERKETAAAVWQILGLNQSRLAKRRGRFRLICHLRTFVVVWTLADWLLSRLVPPSRGGTQPRSEQCAPWVG